MRKPILAPFSVPVIASIIELDNARFAGLSEMTLTPASTF
jgi:hypothetical protein